MHDTYQAVIGLEIHVELNTKAKMFCRCPADYFGKAPNSQTCPVCLGLPGALPVPNRKAVEYTQMIGKALNCTIAAISKFDRKHYFYPDLPKGYQISQYDEPLAVKGHFGEEQSFRIRRVHLEEDTGKLIHQGNETLIDFNRSGVPLVEIVTEPDFDSADNVKRFLEELQVVIRYLGVSSADMEKGSMRLEPNISVQVKSGKSIKSKATTQLPNYKVEIKNINSFKFVKQAIEYELKRQMGILEKGEIPKQETRGFDEDKKTTYSQRTKEEAHDYRYFPEPDIPPMVFDAKDIERCKLPELPHEKMQRYVSQCGLKPESAYIITRNIKTAAYFEAIIADPQLHKTGGFQAVASLIINKKISPQLSVDQFVTKANEILTVKKTDEAQLSYVVDAVIKTHAKASADYKAGKRNSIMFLVGQVMKEMKGQADAQVVKKKIEEVLNFDI